MTVFVLDHRLADESVLAVSLTLCDVLLRDDARTLWVVLVPRLAGLEELHDLSADDQARLMLEVGQVSKAVGEIAQPTKVNTGALGNIVRQLHVHIMARYEGDFAWPGPVWGVGERVPMDDTLKAERLAALRDVLQGR
ncbi:HIT family protein [Pyruvatibacter sp. HU-CL02332]|uniref:HIT family protein n=1 Tax=Pyruvatibacter sp. HU-CL02332 TaxID=3127650 RepID=UPI0031072067